MSAPAILLAVITAIVLLYGAKVHHRAVVLDELEKDLEEKSLELDERSNRIAAEEQTIRGEWESLRKAHDEIIGKKADKTTTPTE